MGNQEPALQQADRRARRSIELRDSGDRLPHLVELVLLEQGVGKHQQQRRLAGELLDAVEEHLLGLREIAPLQGHRREAAVGPLVAGVGVAAPLGEHARGLEILASESQFEAGKNTVDVLRLQFDGLVHVGPRGRQVAVLTVPGASGQPGLHVLGLILDQAFENQARGGLVIKFLLEDRTENDVGLSRRGAVGIGIERAGLHVEAHHLGDGLGGILEIVAPHQGPRRQELDEAGVERPAVFLRIVGLLGVIGLRGVICRRRVFDLPRLEPLAEHREMFPSVDGATDADLELGEPPPQVVVLGTPTDGGFERVVGPRHVVPRGVRRLRPTQHQFGKLRVGIVVFRTQADVATVEGDCLGGFSFREPLLRHFRQVAGVSGDLKPPQEVNAADPHHQSGDEDQEKLQVDPFHVWSVFRPAASRFLGGRQNAKLTGLVYQPPGPVFHGLNLAGRRFAAPLRIRTRSGWGCDDNDENADRAACVDPAARGVPGPDRPRYQPRGSPR